jgi:hypothetical protein
MGRTPERRRPNRKAGSYEQGSIRVAFCRPMSDVSRTLARC